MLRTCTASNHYCSVFELKWYSLLQTIRVYPKYIVKHNINVILMYAKPSNMMIISYSYSKLKCSASLRKSETMRARPRSRRRRHNSRSRLLRNITHTIIRTMGKKSPDCNIIHAYIDLHIIEQVAIIMLATIVAWNSMVPAQRYRNALILHDV